MHKSWLECEWIIKKYITGKELPKVIISQRRQMENNLQQGFFFKKRYISDTFSESTKYFLLIFNNALLAYSCIGCSARDWDGKDYLRIIPRVVW